jgi:hypothetical protein
MTLLGWTIVALLLAQPAQRTAEPTSAAADAKAIVKRAADALARVQIASYQLDYKTTGWMSAFFPNYRGPVMVGKDTANKAQRFKCTITVEPSNSSEVREVTAGADGDVFFIIDTKTRTVHADIDPGVLGKDMWVVQFSVLREFALSNPFEDALKSGEFRLEEARRVDGEDCFAVWIKPSTDPPATWYFAKKDFLPRRVSYAAKNEKGEESVSEMTLGRLVIIPQPDKDPFAIVVPEGYKKTDDFAP